MCCYFHYHMIIYFYDNVCELIVVFLLCCMHSRLKQYPSLSMLLQALCYGINGDENCDVLN